MIDEQTLTCGKCPAVHAENWERGMLCPVTGYNCCAEDECCCNSDDFDKAIKALEEARGRE